MKARILVVDDEDTIRKLLKSRLEREGYDVVVAASADEAEKALKSGADTGVVVTDIKMPGKDGFALMAEVHEKHPDTRVILITGHGEKDVAVRALKLGAADYLEKPFDLDELAHSVKRCLHEHELERDNRELVDRLEARVERVEGKNEDRYWYVSKASSMAKVNEWLSVLKRESMRGGGEEPSVLILGESGTGKEGIARMVHAASRRGHGPWVAVNCANFSEQLLESELFGHEKGAFTGAGTMKRGLFEIAKNGTLFLDEVGEMDTKLQAKLLRVLQEKSFRRVGGTVDLQADVRVVAATNQDLKERVADGRFRDDLFHRLSRVVVDVPALRERREDIEPMATEFARRAFGSRTKAFTGFTTDAAEALRNYDWPGNVRELLNVIERAALIWQGHGAITAKALALPAQGAGGTAGVTTGRVASTGTRLSLVGGASDEVIGSYTDMKRKWSESFEREYLVSTLARHKGNVSAAAREAKIDRSNFLRLLRKHQLKAQEYRTKIAA